MRWIELTEAPIEIATHDFDKDGGSFSDRDTRLHRNPKALEKIKKRWHTSVADLNLFLMNREGVAPNEAIAHTFFGGSEEFEAKAHELGFRLDDNAINCILTNNYGGLYEVPLTGWMIAHRLWHAITGMEKWAYRSEDGQLQKTLNAVCCAYGCGVYNLAACVIGRSKSCREQTLSQSGELLPELFAEYLFTGKVRLNRLPDVMIDRKLGSEYPIVRSPHRSGDNYAAILSRQSIRGDMRADGYETWKETGDAAVTAFELWINEHYADLIQHAIGKCYVL